MITSDMRGRGGQPQRQVLEGGEVGIYWLMSLMIDGLYSILINVIALFSLYGS
jgi:hypothetical protein